MPNNSQSNPSPLIFDDAAAHRSWLRSQAALPRGFRVGSTALQFVPMEFGKEVSMRLTMLALDRPTTAFAAMFTRNAFPGAPVLVGRRRLSEPSLQAVLINNKISNVCAPGGEQAAETLCAQLAQHMGCAAQQVLPSSTGVIGWQLPVDAMKAALPALVASLQSESVLPAAEGIMTTDLYPKIRCAAVGQGRIVGIAKGAGMIEPNLATMLVYLLTDVDLPRDTLRTMLARTVQSTFNAISIDSDQSTSDTVALLSSQDVPCTDPAAFERELYTVCRALAQDVVRNGEGVHHVMAVTVRGAPSQEMAKGVGKSVVNSPLWQCAVCGNDPNIGRLVMAIGKYIGNLGVSLDPHRVCIQIGPHTIFSQGAFQLNTYIENALIAYFKATELYASASPDAHGMFAAPINYPPHEQSVDITIDLGLGQESCTVWGSDRSHEYISENADYRS